MQDGNQSLMPSCPVAHDDEASKFSAKTDHQHAFVISQKTFNPETSYSTRRIGKMPRAFVLINVESGSEDEALKELKKIEGVEEAYFSYGVYDLITRIKADTMESLKDMVSRKIRTLNKVRSTLTLIMMEE